MPPDAPNSITRLFRGCEPNEPLAPADPRYIDLDVVRGENVVEQYERSLRRCDPAKPDVKLFAGHRGVGKTSELLRLKSNLENPDRGQVFKVIFFDAGDALDVNDLDFPDLLVCIAGETLMQLKDANVPGFDGASKYLQRVWDDLWGVLQSEITIKDVSLETGFGGLTAELRNRPNSRSMLREEIEKQSTNLLKAVNDLLTTASVALAENDMAGLVLLIDGLDKIVRREISAGFTTHDRLFFHRHEQLSSLRAHVVYTVPISLIYSAACAQLEVGIGEHNTPVSMINLRGKDRAGVEDDSPGMKKMREMLEARCQHANVNFSDAFETEATASYLCRMTGGHPRHLMMFIQSALDELDQLPITKDAAQRAVRKYANSLLREVPSDFWPLLRLFDEPQDTIPTDDDHQQMLYLLHVFEYMNGQPWYEINPVFRTLERYRAASRGG
ncbi:MAG: hypothetical protein EA377_08230 [Phycisphaerales bacterium]|nr:MAG: hypothetical protein EA377_08230 [Phycisphaerales bacterium]